MLPQNSCNELRLEIAEIAISVASFSTIPLVYTAAYAAFISSSTPLVKLKLNYTGFPSLSGMKLIFDSGGSWDMYRQNGRYLTNFYSFEPQRKRYQSALFAKNFREGEIYFEQNAPAVYLQHPLEYPLDEVLMVQLLALRRGLMVHACGIDFQGKGVLFVGASGQGKSTLAKLLKDKGCVLSDDRIILRKPNQEFKIYGTPWHGDANIFHPGNASLSTIFFIRHAGQNFTRRINAIEATARLITGAFCPYWDKKGMVFSLRFCEQLFNKIAAYELGFLPNNDIWSFLQDKI